MTFQKPETAYWERKLIAYLHDPLDKILQIPGHESRSALFLEKYGLQRPNEEFWKKADGMAAGFERGQVPSYSKDEKKNGAVDFLKNPVITHPTSEKAQLKILLPNINADLINRQLMEFIENDIGMKAGQGGYSDQFKNDEDRFAVARFLYTHLALRFKLADENIGGLGALWHRIPADTRFPDHSIWQHNALCSAFNSCLELSKDSSDVGLMVFSITPVQPFIAKARKLRDYWSASILLSWLAFEGMRWIIENLGPDHILYPSLIDQPLVNEYMKTSWKVSLDSFLNPPRDIATFPNKFLFLVPPDKAEDIALAIKKHIRTAWNDLSGKIYGACTSLLGSWLTDEEKACVQEIFERQNSNFWNLQWAATYLVTKKDKAEIEKLLPARSYINQFDLLSHFNEIIKDKEYYDKSGRGVLYSVSHTLAQTALAVSKYKNSVTRLPETGEKCHLCGEFEVLHHKKYEDNMSAGEYKKNTRSFWEKLKTEWDGDDNNNLGYNLNKNEKLCSICLTKRMAFESLKNDGNHILHSVFKDKKSFPSTTEIALTNFFERENIADDKRKETAQKIHEKQDDRSNSHDRYFTVLLMDGDKMGKLVNGETLASSWESVMHPDIVNRLKQENFEKKYHDNWKEIFKNNNKRLLTPAVHAAISESLGDFSLYGVAGIIKKYKGTLIYAGGDDVCAVLPVETSFKAAFEIQRYYTSTYKFIPKDKSPENVGGTWETAPGKLSVNLGKGDGISISAAILVCHHKESLTQMIANAHGLLDDRAKAGAGRNACAIELRKRSGGSRYFIGQWSDEKKWDSFQKIGEGIKSQKQIQEISTSLIYRLEQLRSGIEAILKQDNWRDLLHQLIAKQLDRSSVGNKQLKNDFADKMIDIVINNNNSGQYEYKPESLIVAAFMAKGGE